ncbi:hypothetical protein Dsin_022560 [Dipteronia sinensis]|uniref:Uncharacterized protein n=1 Tax=Dipteronia sinensis TaxID=43782 RepID=A0AAE0A260_9ROSI|nr:hypothetical protein Dsin_022560 [Dipteronia sinensis]
MVHYSGGVNTNNSGKFNQIYIMVMRPIRFWKQHKCLLSTLEKNIAVRPIRYTRHRSEHRNTNLRATKMGRKHQKVLHGDSCFEILNCLLRKVQREDHAFMCMMLLDIWLNRNPLIHKQKVRQSGEILDWVVSYLEEFQNTQSSLKCLPKDVQGSRAAVWLPPPVGSFSDKFRCSSKGWPGLYWNWCSYLGFHGEGVGDYFKIGEGIFFCRNRGVVGCALGIDSGKTVWVVQLFG